MPVTSRMTSKAQTTVPRAIREALQLSPGDELEWERDGEIVQVRKVRRRRKSAFDKWTGYATRLEGVDVDAYIEEMRGR